MTVADYIPAWLAFKKSTVKPSSYAVCTNVAYTVILPKFGADELDAIDECRLQEWVGDMVGEARLARRTIHDRVVHMCGFLAFAERRKVRAPQGRLCVKVPRVFAEEDESVHVIGEDVCRLLVGAVRDELCPKSVGMVISLMAGLRIGEVCGLKWADIDVEKNVIRVRRTVYRCYENTADGGRTRVVVGPPKSRTSRRDVPMASALKELVCRLARPSDAELFFLSAKAKPLEVRDYRSFVDGLLSRHGIARFKYHSLRHTFATQCIGAGCDAKTVSQLLGHSTVNLTLNLYVHPGEEEKRRAVEAAFGLSTLANDAKAI